MSQPESVLPSLVNWTESWDGLQGPSVIWNRPRRAPTPVGYGHRCWGLYRGLFDLIKEPRETHLRFQTCERGWRSSTVSSAALDSCDRNNSALENLCTSRYMNGAMVVTRWRAGPWPGLWLRLHRQEPGRGCRVAEQELPWPPRCICNLL